MSDLVPSVAALAIQGGKVLLVRHEEGAGHITGMYGLPSGRKEKGERDIETAAREFQEETGLSASVNDLSEFPGNHFVAQIPRKGGIIVGFSWHVFRVNKFSGELHGDDKTTPEWVPVEQLEEFEKQGKLLANTINAVNAALK